MQHKHSNTLIKYVITAESAKKYLIHITQQIFNEQNGISDLLKIISNGNIKKYLLCMYFFFHSCKVRISPLFKAFLEEKPIGDKLTEHFFIEALMAVHTPFFDTQASQLPNIFNAGNFCEKNSWANTLSIIRILQFLHHNPQPAQKKELFNFFMEHGYDSNILSSAFETAFEFHLIVAPCGSRARDVAQSDTIKISKFGKYCLDCLLKEISYLQYIVDDTPMLKDYITPISEKYCIDDYKINRNSSSPKETKTSKRKRMEAIDMFIKFLQLEEEMVLGLNKNYAYYKGRLGFHIEGNNASLAEYIDRETRTGRENIINHMNG